MHARNVRCRSLIPICLTAMGIACVEADPIRGRSQLDAAVGRAAAAALGPDGRFSLPAAKSANGDAIISAAQARRLAMSFLRTFGPAIVSGWVEDRGGPIDLASLQASPRIFFAQSPYKSVPRHDVHAAHRRHHGPYYLVTLLEGDEPAVQIAVSALATDYRVANSGLLQAPPETGMDFVSSGIPLNGSFRPTAPEEAVDLITQATGAVVQEVPELVLTGGIESPVLARWKIELDRPIKVRSRDGQAMQGQQTFYVGSSKQARFAVADQAVTEHRRFMVLAGERAAQPPVPVSVRMHEGHPGAFTIVDISTPEE